MKISLLTVVCLFLFAISFSGGFSAELPECMQELMTEKTKDYYQHFIPILEEK